MQNDTLPELSLPPLGEPVARISGTSLSRDPRVPRSLSSACRRISILRPGTARTPPSRGLLPQNAAGSRMKVAPGLSPTRKLPYSHPLAETAEVEGAKSQDLAQKVQNLPEKSNSCPKTLRPAQKVGVFRQSPLRECKPLKMNRSGVEAKMP
jgi:hypothetical protein